MTKLQMLTGNIRGKVVWVTGASTGIGAALAVEASQLGAKLVISARSEDKLQDVRKKCLGRISTSGPFLLKTHNNFLY